MTAQIDVYADVICPFAYVGLTRVLAHRDAIERPDVRFRIRPWPLELVNGKPIDGHFIGEEIEEIAPQVAPDLFEGFDEAVFPLSSLPALALTEAAYAVDLATGEAVAMAIRTALFEQARDVSDPEVLTEIGAAHGMDTAGSVEQVLAEYENGQARGVKGSPHFFTPTMSVFCPVLDIHRIEGRLEVGIDRKALEGLLEACFGASVR